MKLLMIGLFLSLSAFGQDNGCAPITESRGNITVRRILYPDGACNLSVTPTNAADLYRDYSFGHTGSLLVFVNYGVFDGENRFGTREYMLLPNKIQYPQYSFNDETSQLEVTMTNGKKAAFSYSDAQIVSIEGAEIAVDPYLHPRAQGGVDIKVKEGLLIDTGFILDRLASQNSNRTSTIIDAANSTCKVLNKQLFRYKADGDVVFKLSNEDLSKLMSARCPLLKY